MTGGSLTDSAKTLRRFSIDELESEIRRRLVEREENPIPHCDECANFTVQVESPEELNPCSKGKKMKFRVPQSMGEVNSGAWGFYLRGCEYRRAA